MSCGQGFQDSQRRVVIQSEATCGDFNVSASDILPLADRPSMTTRGAVRTERPANTTGYPGAPLAVPAEQGWSLSLAAELQLKPKVAYPPLIQMLVASGFDAAHNGTTKTVTLLPSLAQSLTDAPADYTTPPATVAPHPVSVALAQRGAGQHNARACTFASSFEFDRGKPVIVHFEGQGLKVADTYEVVQSPTFATLGDDGNLSLPLVFLGATLELAGAGYSGSTDTPIGVEALSINFNQTLADNPDPRDAGGFAPSLPAFGPDNPPTVDMRFDQTGHNLGEVFEALEKQTALAFKVELAGLDDVKFSIEFSALQYSGVASENRDGVRAYQVTLAAANPDTDKAEHVKIVYTYDKQGL